MRFLDIGKFIGLNGSLQPSQTNGTRALSKGKGEFMNGESMVLDNGQIIFPVKIEKEVKSELKTVEMKSVNVTDARIEVKETRFARLKKSLRKRSVSIL